jgi:hypothetical protein
MLQGFRLLFGQFDHGCSLFVYPTATAVCGLFQDASQAAESSSPGNGFASLKFAFTDPQSRCSRMTMARDDTRDFIPGDHRSPLRCCACLVLRGELCAAFAVECPNR